MICIFHIADLVINLRVLLCENLSRLVQRHFILYIAATKKEKNKERKENRKTMCLCKKRGTYKILCTNLFKLFAASCFGNKLKKFWKFNSQICRLVLKTCIVDLYCIVLYCKVYNIGFVSCVLYSIHLLIWFFISTKKINIFSGCSLCEVFPKY